MVKAVLSGASSSAGRAPKTLFMGLSRKNIEKLLEGKPILFQGTEVGIPGYEFTIHFGETEQSIAEELKSLAGEVH